MKWSTFYIMIFLVMGGYFIHQHESVHQTIFNSYGIKSEIKHFEKFGVSLTIPEKACPTEECNLAHNINEAIGYQLIPLFTLIGFGFGFIIVVLEEHFYRIERRYIKH